MPPAVRHPIVPTPVLVPVLVPVVVPMPVLVRTLRLEKPCGCSMLVEISPQVQSYTLTPTLTHMTLTYILCLPYRYITPRISIVTLFLLTLSIYDPYFFLSHPTLIGFASKLEVCLHPVTDLTFNRHGGSRIHISSCGHPMHLACYRRVRETQNAAVRGRSHYPDSQAIDARKGDPPESC